MKIYSSNHCVWHTCQKCGYEFCVRCEVFRCPKCGETVNDNTMIRINIKPLSVNEAWQGKRYKTDKYRIYQNTLLWLLPKIKVPEPPYEIHFRFGFSNSLSDWDNPVKPTQDILCKKYGFNDKLIRKAIVETEIVKRVMNILNLKYQQ